MYEFSQKEVFENTTWERGILFADSIWVTDRARARARARVRVRMRCFVVTGRQKGAICTAALQKEDVEERNLGCGWKGGYAACCVETWTLRLRV